MAINADKLNEFLGRAVVDFGATFNAALVRIGDKLGLYKGLAAGGPQTAAELAKRTGTAERYVREWLSAQAAGGYVTYDPAAQKFHLSEEQAFAMADDNSPAFMPAPFKWRSRRSRPRNFSPKGSRPAREWAGTNTMPNSLSAPRDFFDQA